MKTLDLIKEVRLKLDDEVAPRLFGDDDILRALNVAEREFALRTFCIFAGEREAQVKAQSPWVTLPEGTLWVTGAWIDDNPPLRIVTQHTLELGYFEADGEEAATRYSNWRQAVGVPSFLVSDLGPNTVRLVARPQKAGTLFIEGYRLPTAALAATEASVPEIPEAYHTDLVLGALAYLLDVPEEENYNPSMAAKKRGEWERQLQVAMQLLQTATRVHTKVVPPPPGTLFVGAVGNMIGAAPNDNTET